MGASQDAGAFSATKADSLQWVSAVEVAIGRLNKKALQTVASGGPQKDHATAGKGETGCGEILRAWALLDPALPQLVQTASVEGRTPAEVDAEIQSLPKSTDSLPKAGENEHFAAYLLIKAALAHRLWLLARIMTKRLARLDPEGIPFTVGFLICGTSSCQRQRGVARFRLP